MINIMVNTYQMATRQARECVVRRGVLIWEIIAMIVSGESKQSPHASVKPLAKFVLPQYKVTQLHVNCWTY